MAAGTRRFDGTVSLITGASRGIGFAIARRLVDEGGSVVITGRKQEGLDAAIADLGDAATAVAGRADDAEHRAAVFAHIAERHGRLDHLVNNAGINPVYGPILDVDAEAAPQDPRGQRRRDAGVDARGRRRRPLAVGREHRVGRRPRREPRHRVLRHLEGGAHQPHDAARVRARARASASTPSRPPSSRPRSPARSTRGMRAEASAALPAGPTGRARRRRRSGRVPALRRRRVDHRARRCRSTAAPASVRSSDPAAIRGRMNP